MTNSGSLKTLQLTGTNSTELQLTYSQLKSGTSILSKIGENYQVAVRDVTAANANSVASLANVRRVNIRDSIDSIMFLGSNLQKISNEQKLGTITTTSAPIDIAQPLSYFKSHLGVIGSLADADKLSSLRLTDLPSGTLSLSSVEIARNAKALGILLNNPGPFTLDNTGSVTAQQAKDIATLVPQAHESTVGNAMGGFANFWGVATEQNKADAQLKILVGLTSIGLPPNCIERIEGRTLRSKTNLYASLISASKCGNFLICISMFLRTVSWYPSLRSSSFIKQIGRAHV